MSYRTEHLKDGWGNIWQGTMPGGSMDRFLAPTAIVCMPIDHDKYGPPCETFLDLERFLLTINVRIHDGPKDAMSDAAFLGLVDACIGLLGQGINLFIHCVQGVSRSSYLTVGIWMRIFDKSYDEALAEVRVWNPRAVPQIGFEQHLRRLEGVLRS